MLLAGDVGGTKTHLALFSSRDDLKKPVIEERLPSAAFPNLEALVQSFLMKVAVPVERACFGVAGPVIAGQATITNLPWQMSEEHLQQELNIPSVHLLNDLDAMAHAIPALGTDDLLTLNEGQPTSHGSIALIAPGTGLGEAFLTWNGTRYQAYPSEGGHTDFAPTNELEIDLLRYLMQRYEHVSYEHVCSGVGLPNIYAFLRNRTPELAEPAWLSEQLVSVHDSNPVIIAAAMNDAQPCALCRATISLFVAILGAECGNMALKLLATGGVYVGGGIPPRILPFFQDGTFMQAFKRKGRLSTVLEPMPVHIVLNTRMALLGAALHGFDEME